MRRLVLPLALTLALVLCAASAHAQAPTRPPAAPGVPPLAYHKTRHFDMFAPSVEIAQGKEEMVEAAAARFIALMGKEPVRGALVLADPEFADRQWQATATYYKRGAKWMLPWHSRHPYGDGIWPAYGETTQIGGGDPLPHEAAHLMFVFAVNSGCSAGLKQKFNGYGSYLPDWLDEGVAIYVEHQAIRTAQRELMSRKIEDRIPFREFFAMDHPGAPKINGKPNPASGHGFSGGFGRAQIYYMECVTALEFLEAVAGVEGVRKIIRTLQTGATMDKTLKHLPAHYPRDLDGLEQIFVAWIETGELPAPPEPETPDAPDADPPSPPDEK